MAPALRVDMLDAIIPIAKRAVDRLCKRLEFYRGTGESGGRSAVFLWGRPWGGHGDHVDMRPCGQAQQAPENLLLQGRTGAQSGRLHVQDVRPSQLTHGMRSAERQLPPQ